jgi:hypothetical protein
LAPFSGCSRIRLPTVGLFEAARATFGAESRKVIWLPEAGRDCELTTTSVRSGRQVGALCGEFPHMKIGIISDTHGQAGRMKAAMEVLASRGVQAVVHCGDIGSAKCLELLASCGVPAYAVAGNMDRHVEDLELAAQRCGVNFAWEVVEVPIGGRRHLAATHGNDARVLGELVAGGQFPYVCHGHTHARRSERIGTVRVINPGALHHAHPRTLALLDTDADTVEHIVVS